MENTRFKPAKVKSPTGELRVTLHPWVIECQDDFVEIHSHNEIGTGFDIEVNTCYTSLVEMVEGVMRNVTIVEQDDKSFGVLLQDDEEGLHDQIFGWGIIDDDTVITKGEAREAATFYADELCKRFGGKVLTEKTT